jgi:hypothetical protein
MKSVNLNGYSSHVRKIAKAASRNEQLDPIRRKNFRASPVNNPLSEDDDISASIEATRNRKGS